MLLLFDGTKRTNEQNGDITIVLSYTRSCCSVSTQWQNKYKKCLERSGEMLEYRSPILMQQRIEEKLIAQLVKKLPALYKTWRLIAVFTEAHHWTLPGPDESSPHPHPQFF